jgi:hypothetical protein
MIPAVLLSLVIMAESPDNLTPEAAAQLKEMRAAMKEAVTLLEDRKYVAFVDRFIGKLLSDELKGPGRAERIRKEMEEEGWREHLLSKCKTLRDQPLVRWSLLEGEYWFTFEIKMLDAETMRVKVQGKGKSWYVRP